MKTDYTFMRVKNIKRAYCRDGCSCNVCDDRVVLRKKSVKYIHVIKIKNMTCAYKNHISIKNVWSIFKNILNSKTIFL